MEIAEIQEELEEFGFEIPNIARMYRKPNGQTSSSHEDPNRTTKYKDNYPTI